MGSVTRWPNGNSSTGEWLNIFGYYMSSRFKVIEAISLGSYKFYILTFKVVFVLLHNFEKICLKKGVENYQIRLIIFFISFDLPLIFFLSELF